MTVGWIALLVGLFAAPNAAVSTTANDLCSASANPCVITSNHDIDGGSILYFGVRNVILKAKLDVDSANATIVAGSFVVGTNGLLRGLGTASQNGGSYVVWTLNDIALNSTLAAGAVMLNGRSGGSLTLMSAQGSVTGTAKITAQNMNAEGGGGSVTINAGNHVGLSGAIQVTGGSAGGGGRIRATSGGNVSLSGDLALDGGAGGAGSITISSGGSVTLGDVSMEGSFDAGDGGSLDITAEGAVNLGKIQGNGAGGASCGRGGDVEINTKGDITLSKLFRLNAEGLDCCGGSLVLDGANVRMLDFVRLRGTETDGCGGSVDVTSAGEILLATGLEIDGGEGGAGQVTMRAAGNINIQGPIDAHGRGSSGSGSPSVSVESSGGSIRVSANVDAGGAATGGNILLDACDVTVESVSLNAGGDGGGIRIYASDALTLRANHQAGPADGAIDLIYGPAAAANLNLTLATFNITHTETQDPNLAACTP
jgi:hypothetical protein